MRLVDGKIVFWEDHYLRLMASMRILRMSIPMEFTMEFLQKEILRTVEPMKNNDHGALVRLTVYRNDGGAYLPDSNEISYIIEVHELSASFYLIDDKPYEIELFKDFLVNNDLTSTLQTNNKIIKVVGSIYAQENGYHNCLLLNSSKMVVEALNGNVFMVNGNKITTAPLNDGCQNGIVRKKLMNLIEKLDIYELKEVSVSPFDLQKADELFITSSEFGIQPISKYRKKVFVNTVAKDLLGKLNAAARLA
jgi:branched-chain amino acid aminotransferase